jgi:hypothetical protein
VACYFSDYFGPYFEVCSDTPQTDGGITNGGGLIGPSRSDLEAAKRWLKDDEPVRLIVRESLDGLSDYAVLYSVDPGVAVTIEAQVEPVKAKKLPRRKLKAYGSLPVVTSRSSLSLSWATAIKRDDEELMLLL